jgi:formyltetrahydrofolate-dependent phosphoribosylglycinamide formyltransferase
VAYRVAVAVSGRGSNLFALLEALAANPVADVVLVLSDRASPALSRAQSRGMLTHQLRDFRDGAEWRTALETVRADLLVLAGYLKLVPPDVVSTMPGRIINIHPALLPLHGGPGMYGRRVHDAVLASAAPTSGATVHLVDEEFDRGDILGQARVPVHPGDTAELLADRVLAAEHRLLPAAVIAAARAGHPVPFELD